jgi:hypothetical protein
MLKGMVWQTFRKPQVFVQGKRRYLMQGTLIVRMMLFGDGQMLAAKSNWR